MNLVRSITRKATRLPGEKLNVVSFPTHERFQGGWKNVNANFYLWRVLDNSIKDWNPTYGPLPDNHFLLNPNLGDRQIPVWLDIDIILSQNKFGQFQIAKKIAEFYQVPLISLEHTAPVPNWSVDKLRALKSMKGDLNLFISESSRKAWGWEENEAKIIEHGVDTDLFSPLNEIERESVLLSVNNDFINRDWCLNFRGWQRITKDLPVKLLGDTPGLSKAAKDINELVHAYRTSTIYLNTTTHSPIPTAMLEAMSCGCVPVALANCMIPEVIENGINGFSATNEEELRYRCQTLLKNPELCKKMGEAARRTILDRFNMEKFVNNWNKLLYESVGEAYEG